MIEEDINQRPTHRLSTHCLPRNAPAAIFRRGVPTSTPGRCYAGRFAFSEAINILSLLTCQSSQLPLSPARLNVKMLFQKCVPSLGHRSRGNSLVYLLGTSCFSSTDERHLWLTDVDSFKFLVFSLIIVIIKFSLIKF